MRNIITIVKDLAPCPACGRGVQSALQVEVKTVGELADDKVPFEGKVIGAQIRHDCTPKVQR